ncbi:hypothetical protein GJ744_001854 [Endocarpon pusillum]|uniref:Uncharacterized protein n=1 Tax=Endocarpon pusillum TaxID=364733 RepID=A0A8H7ASL5_9EURO|nr:hypothetical protein GJ744_001854 [Endocarpon pusillum]
MKVSHEEVRSEMHQPPEPPPLAASGASGTLKPEAARTPFPPPILPKPTPSRRRSNKPTSGADEHQF